MRKYNQRISKKHLNRLKVVCNINPDNHIGVLYGVGWLCLYINGKEMEFRGGKCIKDAYDHLLKHYI